MTLSYLGAGAGFSAQRGYEVPGPDPRIVAAILQGLAPHVTQFQNGAQQATAFGQASAPTLETLAASALVADLASDNLQRLTVYLDQHSPNNKNLEQVAPLAQGAARALAARDYAQTFNALFDVYRIIVAARIEDGELPLPSSIQSTAINDKRKEDAERNPDAKAKVGQPTSK